MNVVRKIDILPPIPNFNIPEPYCSDYWDIENWDYYKNSNEAGQTRWKTNGNTYDPGIDFTVCENKWIREEIKYYLYKAMAIDKVNLYTFTFKYSKLKPLIRFINTECLNLYSVTEIKDLSAYEEFISEKEKRKKKTKMTVNSGITAKLEKGTFVSTSPFIRVLKGIIELINDFYDDREELEKDVWEISKLPFNISNNSSCEIRTINFSYIQQPLMKETMKEYVKLRANSLTASTIVNNIGSINNFTRWLYENHFEIKSFYELTRPIIEEFIIWLNTISGKTSKNISSILGTINTIFDYLRMNNQKKYVPTKKIIFKDDYFTKVKYEPKPYSDQEMQRINEHLSELTDIQHARMIILLQTLGCRLNEILRLKPEQLNKSRNKYSIKILSTKNNKIHSLPIDKTTAEIVLEAIKTSKERYGNDITYVFAKGIDNYIPYSSLLDDIRLMAYNNNLKDDAGKPLRITFKRFRTTLSCKYLELGIDANIISLVLGHKVKGTLRHYAKLSNPELKEAMKPRLDKFDLLIENIGNIKNIEPAIENNPKLIPLSNGYCNKAIATGICDNANYCLGCAMFQPDEKFLLGYKLQLEETEQAIKKAEENGNERLLETNLNTRERLIEIIKKIEGNSDE